MIYRKRRGPIPISQCVDVTTTEGFVALTPLSGYLLRRPEDGSVPEFLPVDVGQRDLGKALFAALGRCRYVPPDDRDFYALANRTKSYEHSENELIRRTGKRSKTAAYKNAIWCSVRKAEGWIRIQPFRPRGRGTWRMLPENERVLIPDTTDPDALGAALLLAIEKARTFEG